MLLNVRKLIEQLSHIDDEVLIGIKQYTHGSDRVTVNLVEESEVAFDIVFKDGEDKPVILLG